MGTTSIWSCRAVSPEERLPGKESQSEDCRQGGYRRAPGSMICVLNLNRTEASSSSLLASG